MPIKNKQVKSIGQLPKDKEYKFMYNWLSNRKKQLANNTMQRDVSFFNRHHIPVKYWFSDDEEIADDKIRTQFHNLNNVVEYGYDKSFNTPNESIRKEVIPVHSAEYMNKDKHSLEDIYHYNFLY